MRMENVKLHIAKRDTGYGVLMRAIQEQAQEGRQEEWPDALIRLPGSEMAEILPGDCIEVGVIVVKLENVLIIPRLNNQPELPRVVLGAEIEVIFPDTEGVLVSVRQLQKESDVIVEAIESWFDTEMAACLKSKLPTARKIVVEGHDVWQLELSPMEIVPRGDYLIANRQLLENADLLIETDRQICLGLV